MCLLKFHYNFILVVYFFIANYLKNKVIHLTSSPVVWRMDATLHAKK